MHGDMLKLRVSARPIEGEANKAVCEYIAKFFGVPKSSVAIMQGETGRMKVVYVKGDSSAFMKTMDKWLG